MKLKICIFFLSVSIFTWSQTGMNYKVQFVPTFNHVPVVFADKYYTLPKGDSIVFTFLKFYISGVSFFNNDSLVFEESNSFHLMEATDSVRMNFKVNTYNKFEFNSIHFNLGIDSATNVSGALGGDLDPTKGMYWTWQSGYINFRLEGKSNLCKTRNNEFGFHLGGYQSPNYAMQKIVLKSSTTNEIKIEIPFDKFLSQIDLAKQNMVMIPGKASMELSSKIAEIFTILSK